MTHVQPKPHGLRRFLDHKAPGAPFTLDADHPAVVDGATLYRARRRRPTAELRLLKDGHNNRKIGRRVLKGRLKGFPIYTLTLEERATCPPACKHWRDCFGNDMNWSVRIEHGPLLQVMLRHEVAELARQHPRGFLVRLHVLGDFWSLAYVATWVDLLATHPAPHIFGYTAHQPDSPIGRAIDTVARHHWDRFAVRFSNPPDQRERAAITVDDPTARGMTPQGVVCPAQTGDTSCCGTCSLCWSTERNIVFLVH